MCDTSSKFSIRFMDNLIKVNDSFFIYFSKKNSKLLFDKDLSHKELKQLNHEYLVNIFDKNNIFFIEAFNTIYDYLSNHYKIKLIEVPEWTDLETMIRYICFCFLKSFLAPSIKNFYTYNQNGYIDRDDVISSFSDHLNVFRFGSDTVIVKRIVLESLIGLLSSNLVEPITVFFTSTTREFSLKKKVRLRLNISYEIDFSDRIYLNISTIPYVLISDEYKIGASIGSLNYIYKRSLNQKKLNKISNKALIKAANTPIMFDRNIINLFHEVIKLEFGEFINLEEKFKSYSLKYEENMATRTSIYTKLKYNFIFINFINFLATNLNPELSLNSTNIHLLNSDNSVLINTLIKNILSSISWNDFTKIRSFFKKNKVDRVLSSCVKLNPSWISLKVDILPVNDFSTLSLERIKSQFFLIKKLLKQLEEVSKEFSRLDSKKKILIDAIIINKLLDSKIKIFYLPYFYDFRGRLYSHSPLGVETNKFSRSLIILPEEASDFQKLKSSEYYKQFNSSISLFNLEIHSKLLKNLGVNSSRLKIFLVVQCLLELGSIIKSQDLPVNKYKLSLKDLALLGESLYFDVNIVKDMGIYVLLKVKKMILYINKILNGSYKNIILERDSTFSALLHFSYLLTPKNKEISSNLNLSGNNWTDSYSFIINSFFEFCRVGVDQFGFYNFVRNELGFFLKKSSSNLLNLLEDPNWLNLLYPSDSPKIVKETFLRKNLKRSIMTTNYNVSWFSFKNYFFSSLTNLSSDEKFDNKSIKILEFWIFLLYHFVKNSLYSHLFKVSKEYYINKLWYNDKTLEKCPIINNNGPKINEPNFLIKIDGDEVDFSYLTKSDKAIETNIRSSKKILKKLSKSRINQYKTNRKLTFSKYILLDEVDIRKSKQAYSANLIQFYDARLCRLSILKAGTIFTVHDCFGIPINNIGDLYALHSYYFLCSTHKNNVFCIQTSDIESWSQTHNLCLFILI